MDPGEAISNLTSAAGFYIYIHVCPKLAVEKPGTPVNLAYT